MNRSTIRRLFCGSVCLLMLLAGCATDALPTTQATPPKIDFEVVAQGDPMVGKDSGPVTLALRGDAPLRAVPEALPDEARAALEEILSQADASLYLGIYGGMQPSSGYKVSIESITRNDGQLTVAYSVIGPGPNEGAATVMTYPYIIVRLADTTTDPDKVIFEQGE